MATTTHSIDARVKQRPVSRITTGRRLSTILLYTVLIAGCTLTLIPFIWMILTSFKPPSEIIRIPPTLWPETPTLANYQTILSDPKLPLWRFYLNSLFVTGSIVLLTLFTSSLAGFIFAKYEFAGKNIIFGFILATLMIPFQVTMIPAYLLLVRLGLIDSLWGLVVSRQRLWHFPDETVYRGFTQ
jgi:ABC-type glycerol-3-phosphate transport system permease component